MFVAPSHSRACLCLSLLLIASASEAVDAQYDGCEQVISGPVCLLNMRGELSVWIDVQQAEELRWLVNDEVVIPDHIKAVADGLRFTFALRSSAAAIRADDANGTNVFALDLANARPNGESRAALQAMTERRYHDALRIIDTALPTADALHVPRLLRTRARVHARLGQRAASHVNYRTAIAAANAAGDLSTLVLAAAALEFSLRQDVGDLEGAQAVLDQASHVDRRHAESSYLLNYHGAMIAYRRGDVRTHLSLMTNAATQAARFDWTHRAVRADMRLAVQWQDLGRQDKAINTLEKWHDSLPSNYPGMHEGIFLTNLGWAYWLALEAQDDAPDPLPILRRALSLTLEHGAVSEQINTYVNLGLALWHDGQFDAAADALHASRQYPVAPATHILYWSLDLEARIAAARGDINSAIALYDQMLTLANANAAPATAWRALVRRAGVRAQVGDASAARADFAQAETLLDEQVLRVPVHEGRESMLATRRFATRQHLTLLLAEGDSAQALALWRRSHTRSLRLTHVAASIANLDDEQRRRWTTLRERYQALRNDLQHEQINSWALSAEQLTALNKRAARSAQRTQTILDEALTGLPTTSQPQALGGRGAEYPLVAFARASDGWVVFVEQDADVTTVRSNCVGDTDTAIAQCLLDAATPVLSRAIATRLLTESSLVNVDWPALQFGGTPWIEHTALIHISALPDTLRRTPTPGHALLVGDPTGNLRAARDEVLHIATVIDKTPGWAGTTVSGDQATAATVRDLLQGASLFHYAGHASYGDALGWESALHLAGGSQLGVGDVLTLDQVPQVVVLSGCETAGKPGIHTPSMGLANAFLAAGSQSVIATSRAVDDVTARAITSAFYQNWFAGQSIEQALRSAQRAVKDTQPGADWSAFRLIQP